MTATDRTALGHRTLVRLEEARASITKDIAWYEARRTIAVAAASTFEFSMEQARWYDGMIAEQRTLAAFVDRMLADDGWQVTSDEYPDLADSPDDINPVLAQYMAEGR